MEMHLQGGRCHFRGEGSKGRCLRYRSERRSVPGLDAGPVGDGGGDKLPVLVQHRLHHRLLSQRRYLARAGLSPRLGHPRECLRLVVEALEVGLEVRLELRLTGGSPSGTGCGERERDEGSEAAVAAIDGKPPSAVTIYRIIPNLPCYSRNRAEKDLVMQTSKKRQRASEPVTLSIANFAHIRDVKLSLGDLTVLVGPQGAGKSLALQWLKIGMDGRQVIDALRAAGHAVDKPDVVVDLIFGAGMAPAWRDNSKVRFDERDISPKSLSRVGNGRERLFFVPAHRAMLISDGWAAPFQKLGSDTPAVARLFSQNLFDRFSGKDAGTLFPVEKRLKKEIREKIDAAVFHGGKVGIADDSEHARRLRLVHNEMHLPFMTWTAGQREFTPLLLALYHLLPSTLLRKREETDWVVLEEPEMGLHPQAITAVMLLVLDLLWRGYRVVLSTHSPHVVTMVWMMQQLKAQQARWQLVCEAFDVKPSGQIQRLAESSLIKDYRAHLLEFDAKGRVTSKEISGLDPSSEDEQEAGWGGLTEYSSRFGEAVRNAVNERDS